MLKLYLKNININKTVIFFIAVFFIFSGVSFASIATSKSYKLYTAGADGGGVSGGSTSYNSENSVGFPDRKSVV